MLEVLFKERSVAPGRLKALEMSKQELPPREALYPVPVVLVSCLDRDNQSANIITIAWCGVACSKPPLLTISIRPSRLSHEIINKTGDFTVNIPTEGIIKNVDICGIRSGREIDKFKICSFTQVSSSKIYSPMIKECPVNIECKLKDVVRLGTHDMFIGEVVSVHADSDIIDQKGRIDYSKARPLVYNQGEYWNLGKKIGHYGFSSQ